MNRKSELIGRTNRKGKVPWLLVTTGIATAALFALIFWPGEPTTYATDSDIVVYKTATCSCCGKWVSHLRDAGLKVGVVNVSNTQTVQMRVGVPRELGSCHTAVVGDYWVEGHVPADLVQQLIAEKPGDLSGIAVPGMPMGSPGMEGPNATEYDVVAYGANGRTSVYATRQGRSQPGK
jgi:hypothetical protein